MKSTEIQRARAARKFGVVLMVAALLPIVWFVAGSVNPAVPTFATLLPVHRAPWMPHPIALVCALASFALMWFGATLVARQKTVFESAKRDTEDRLRRVREYGSDGRIEPYIGTPITFDNDKEPR